MGRLVTTAIALPDRVGGNDRYPDFVEDRHSTLQIWVLEPMFWWGDHLGCNSYADALSANYLAGALDAKFNPTIGV